MRRSPTMRTPAFHFPFFCHLATGWIAAVAMMPPAAAAVSGSESALLPERDRSQQTRVIRVGRSAVKSIAEAAKLARDGDTVEIEAGDYFADVAIWNQAHLTIRGVQGRPRLIAAGAAAGEKAIWVVSGRDVTVENIEFMGARVADKNGAGIRFEGARLVVRNCRFEDNENGILGGNDDSELEIHNSEFVRNGAGDGYSHNIYVEGRRVVVHGSYIARSRVGHLLKSRARETLVLYNRLSGEDGTSSYELEFPDGGTALVIGNLIEQGPKSENSTIISFGAERFRWPENALYLSHNTIVNDRPGNSVPVFVRPGSKIIAVNNILVGAGTLGLPGLGSAEGNMALPKRNFSNPLQLDYRLRFDSPAVGNAISTESDRTLTPDEEYVHPAGTKRLGVFAPANPGAFQSVVMP